MAYDWPGNVRELRNTMERAVILCGEGYLETRHLPPTFGQRSLRPMPGPRPTATAAFTWRSAPRWMQAERMLILKTLESTRNNKTRAAEILGISLKTLHNKLKEYGSATSSETAEERPVA